MLFIAQIFIVNSKNFWDVIYFEKLSNIYNTQFIFSTGDKVGLKKLYDQSKKQLQINRVAKILAFLGIAVNFLGISFEEFLGVTITGRLYIKVIFDVFAILAFGIDMFILFNLIKST